MPLKTLAFRYSVSELSETSTERRTMGVAHGGGSVVDSSVPTAMAKAGGHRKKRRKHAPDADEALSAPTLSRRIIMPFMMTCTVLRIADA